MNREFATNIIKELLQWGVEEFHVCAGARDIPLIEAICSISSDKKIIFNHFEERNAAFYALGRIKSLKRPVAVVCTSGTAVGELLPATMEAYYSGLPLVLISADRPPSYRGTGAPQSAEQKNIFGPYVSHCFDLDFGDVFSLQNVPLHQPVHINVCFSIPLQSGELKKILKPSLLLTKNKEEFSQEHFTESRNKLNDFLKSSKKLLVIVSQLEEENKQGIVSFLQKLNVPVYIESISNMREWENLEHIRIHCGDRIWKHASQSGFNFDSVLKIGGTPTHRFWRDLDEKQTEIRVLSISSLPFPGMPKSQQITINPNYFLEQFCKDFPPQNQPEFSSKFLDQDRNCWQKILNLFSKYPNAEQSIFYHLSNKIRKHSRVFIGNSLPIRYWDLAASFENKSLWVNASRGLNGIDGQVSTFLGFAEETATENWGIFGDLTTLYDMAGPWILKQRPNLNAKIVVINNGGGRIFRKVLQGPVASLCQNEHQLNFKPLAHFWQMSYSKVENILEFSSFNKSQWIEIIPNQKHTFQFEDEYSQF